MSGGAPDPIDFVGTAPVPGSLDVVWNHGTRRGKPGDEPPIQVHRYDEHTVILRQSKNVSYEAPFIFLLFGDERALLLDTGATEDPRAFPLRATVDGLIERWLDRHPRTDYGLVVAHTHGHGDHHAGDAQFAGRAHTTVVGCDLAAVQAYFGFDAASWPAQDVRFDLGGRVLTLFGSPGHHETAVTCYDPWTGILFTGDTILPGRLYAFDFPAFRDSVRRTVVFALKHRVGHVFGCHVEMTDRPGRDYPVGARYQPHERAPQMTVAQLVDVGLAVDGRASRQGVHVFDDFIVYNEPGKKEVRGLKRRAIGAGLVALVRAKTGV